MEEPLTEELLRELLDAPDPQWFLDRGDIATCTLSQHLQKLLAQKSLERIDVIHRAGINETYGYQLFTGEKQHPSRDKLIAIGFAMRLTLVEINRLLKIGGANELYCKNRRDAIIIFCLDRGYTLAQTDEQLYRFDEDTIA